MVRTHRVALPLLGVLTFAGALTAQSPIRYIYDELGRLVGVIDASGEAAAYHYDEVGNLTAITRSTPTQVAIIEFTPNAGAAGQTVTIHGTGFSATPSSNTVTFNGTGATVATATSTTLTVTVPGSATTGAIAVTSPNGSATSATSFIVGSAAAPSITGFSPAVGVAGTAVTVTGTNFDSVLSLNRLVLNASYTSVTSATTTSLATGIAPAVSSGRFVVRTPAGTATSADDFFVVPPPYAASDVAATGRLQVSSPFNLAIGTASKVGLVVFDGTSGQRISLKIVPGPLSTVKLYRPNTDVLATHSTGILTTLMEPPLLPSTGTYQFMVDPAGSVTGTTALTLYHVPADFSGTITPGGSPATITTTVPGQNGMLTFSGANGDRVAVSVSGGPSGVVHLRKPDGSTLVSGTIFTLASFIDTTTLPASGTYSLFADYAGIATGSVTLTLHAVPPDVSGTITPGGAPVNVVLTTPGQNGLLTFAGTVSQRVSLKVSSGPSGTVSLRRPDGSVQASVASGLAAAFMEPQMLATTGTYSVKADPTGAATGTLTLTLYDVPADTTGTVTIGGSAVAVPLGTPGQNGTLTFSGTASQQVTVRMTGNTFGLMTVRLLKPDGSQLTSTISASSSFNLATQTLPVTGTYTIVVDPSAANVGTVNVSVTNP